MVVEISAVTQTPYIIEDNGILRSETNLSLFSDSEVGDVWVKTCIQGQLPIVEKLGAVAAGHVTKTVHVAELTYDGDRVGFELYGDSACSGLPLAAVCLPQKKVRHWTVYVSHSSHIDIGYTDYQEILRNEKWPAIIDQAIQFVSDTDDWSDDNQFRHQIESSYLLYGSAFNVRSADWIEKFKTLLLSGRLAYAAGCMNTSMEIMGGEELVRYYYYSARLLKDMLGIESSNVAMMIDNPSISWSNVDIMADAGIRYMILGPNFNWHTPKLLTDTYPRIFYMHGRQQANKILLFNSNLYNLDEMQFVPDGPDHLPVPFSTTVKCTADVLMNTYHKDNYPYDAVLQYVDQYFDNGSLLPEVMERVRAMNTRTDVQGRAYLFPRFINSNVQDFCRYIDSNFNTEIPSFTGTFENWWSYGAAADAFSGAEIRYAHERVPAAETLATLASLTGIRPCCPVSQIAQAYNLMTLYDEHTFAASAPKVDEQHIWKRNTALTSQTIATDIIEQSLTSLSSQVRTDQTAVFVCNPLAWARSDIARIPLSELPEYFDIIDPGSGMPLKYQKMNDGFVEFLANDVPGMGYKCFSLIARADTPVFTSSLRKTAHSLENDFYQVTLDKQGEIASIIDKRHGFIELVDASAPYKMNEFVYMLSESNNFPLHSISQITNYAVDISSGVVQGRISITGSCYGTAGLTRNIVLYDAIPRIDFINVINKNDALNWLEQDEEGYFVFPFNVPDFQIRHEMPVGDVRPYVDARHADPTLVCPEIEQFYTSSTDFYTVNRWIDASSQSADYGITLSPISTPIVQYGERRSILYGIDYNTPKPWIYSYALSNKWGTNFIKTQPGIITLRYSLQTHSGQNWRDGRADHFGRGIALPLLSRVIPAGQNGHSENPSQWLRISADNIALSTAKFAESNGEGLILRFNETLGKDTKVTVDLSVLNPTAACETNLMEEDRVPLMLEGGSVTFDIAGYGWKTLRIITGGKSAAVKDVKAVSDDRGTLVTWGNPDDQQPSFFEVFRYVSKNDQGNYLGSTTAKRFFDRQVTADMAGRYGYSVRAVLGGCKGSHAAPVTTETGIIDYSETPTAPADLKVNYAFGNRVSLSWSASTDQIRVEGYKVYRNGRKIADLSEIFNSFLDISVIPGETYRYSVKACNIAGLLSEASDTVIATTVRGMVKPGNIASDATILASSQFSDSYPATAVADGLIGVTGEWAAAGERNPWIRLTWPQPHVISRVVLYDRDADVDHARHGVLYFSDGSQIEVDGIPENGSARSVLFTPKFITWVKFQVTNGRGWNVGLAEIEIYEDN